MDYEKSFRATWSQALEKYGYTQVANRFLEYYHKLGITQEEAMFVIHCVKYKWTIESPYPSLATIAKAMGISRNSVQRYARSLQNKGLIKRIRREGAPSKINIEPLIKKLELVPYLNLDDGDNQKCTKPCPNPDTKEDPSIKKYKKKEIYSGMQPIKETLGGRYPHPISSTNH